MSQNYQYNTIEEALRDLKEGKIVLVTDDPDRENEGDLICAAEFATRENINFMATYAKGLICTPMSAEIAVRLRKLLALIHPLLLWMSPHPLFPATRLNAFTRSSVS